MVGESSSARLHDRHVGVEVDTDMDVGGNVGVVAGAGVLVPEIEVEVDYVNTGADVDAAVVVAGTVPAIEFVQPTLKHPCKNSDLAQQ